MINLDNYEEYFLLYIDDELNGEQRTVVEMFVQQHPHLAAELNMLKETKLLPEEGTFSNKDCLYKTAGSSININNYEEYFLLHTDKELSANQEAAIEQFVLQHPQLQEEFLLIQQAILVPEIMECPGKQRLYRQPGKRIIPLYITKMAIAAAITGVIVLAGNIFINNNKHPEVAKNTQPNKPVETNVLPQKNSELILPEKKNSDVAVAKNEAKKTSRIPVTTTKINKEKSVVKSIGKNDNEPAIVQINALPNAPQTAPEDRIATAVAAKQKSPTVLKPLEEIDEQEPASVMYASNNDAIAKPTVYKELSTEDDDQTLYVGSLQLNKAKVNGLFKKAAHLLGGKAKDSSL